MRRTVSTTAIFALANLLVACGDGSTSAAPVELVTSVRTFVDSSRPTPANGTYAGAPERTLETRLWLSSRPLRDRPACGGDRCALVVLAHGFGGSTARFDAIGRGLAEVGYVVAAPSFPLTNEAAPGGHLTGIGDTVEQPADLSFVIDRLYAASGDATDGLLGGRIDPDRLAVLGHSLGGVTAIALSRAPCCVDPRLDAVVLVAPLPGLVAGLFGESFDTHGPPTLVVGGSADPVVAPELPAGFYDEIEPPKAYVRIAGAGHSDLIENTGPPAPFLDPVRRAVIAFLDQLLGGGHDLVPALNEIGAEGQTVRYDLGS